MHFDVTFFYYAYTLADTAMLSLAHDKILKQIFNLYDFASASYALLK